MEGRTRKKDEMGKRREEIDGCRGGDGGDGGRGGTGGGGGEEGISLFTMFSKRDSCNSQRIIDVKHEKQRTHS